MRLNELYIEKFGKLSDYKYTFSQGLNVINEENGYGKTTLSAFIKSMLYGLEDTRRTKIDENDRKKYLPWQGGVCGGTLTFTVNDKKYKIERTFAQKAADDTFALYDCTSGNEIAFPKDKVLGEELFGINADGFERTVFLSERRFSVKNDNKTISAKLSDLVGCDGDVGELDNAIDALEERRKYYYKKGGAGKISDVRELIGGVDDSISEIMAIQNDLPDKEYKLSLLTKEIGGLERKLAEFESKRILRSNEKMYIDKRDARDQVKKELATIESFFKAKLPTAAEIRMAERVYDEYIDLSEKSEGESFDNTKANQTKEEIARVSELYEKLVSYDKKKKPVKIFPVLLPLAAVLSAVGGVFCAVPSIRPFGIIGGAALIVTAVILIALGVANAAKQISSKPSTALMDSIKAYLSKIGMSYVGESEYKSALFEVKMRLEGEIRIEEEKQESINAKRLELARLGTEYRSFIEQFPIATDDAFGEIRDNLARYEKLCARAKEMTDDLAYMSTTYGLDAEKLANKNEITELTDDDRIAITDELRTKRSAAALMENECRINAEKVSALDELFAKKTELTELYDYCKKRLATINGAKEYLALAKENLTSRYLGKTREAFAEYVKAIGNENPEQFTMDTSFGLVKSEGAKSQPTEAYSLGTRDVFSLCSRLALVDSLYENESPFIILDDPFAHFDDKKCQAALKSIKKMADKKQIIYLTCSKSRAL